VQHDPGHFAAGQMGSEHVAQFVHGLQPEPGAEERGDNQDRLMQTHHR